MKPLRSKEFIFIAISLILLIFGTWCDLATVPMAGAVSIATITFGGWFRIGLVSILLAIGLIGVISSHRLIALTTVSVAVGFLTEILLSGLFLYQEKTALMAEMAGAGAIKKAIVFGAGGPLMLVAWIFTIVSMISLNKKLSARTN